MRQVARRAGMQRGQQQERTAGFVRDQICTFVAEADDERWTQLISATQGTEDPALGCVRAILKGKLQPPARAYTLIKRT